MINHIISISGGKDSGCTVLLAQALEYENLALVFADTGHEEPQTYEYLEYLSGAVGLPIRTVKADFSNEIERKRQKLIDGELPGWSDSAIERALQVLAPTGNPFLDLCLWKGRFPSSKARFCTEHLKRDPIIEQVFLPLLDAGEVIWSWQGVRRDESDARRYAPGFEEVGGGLYIHRPLARWPAGPLRRYFKLIRIWGLNLIRCIPRVWAVWGACRVLTAVSANWQR